MTRTTFQSVLEWALCVPIAFLFQIQMQKEHIAKFPLGFDAPLSANYTH